jgi:CHASE3 domain sensor protein
MLHFMLPALSLASMSHQSFWATLKLWLGGSQLETVNTVSAEAAPLASSVAEKAVARALRSFM